MSRTSWLVLVLGLIACEGVPQPLDGGADAALDRCRDDLACDDAIFCDGEERCEPASPLADARGCVESAPPCATGMRCRESTDRCETCEESDLDGDGDAALACGGTDCDDEDPQRYPGNAEICDALDHDEDCDASTFGVRDADRDGYPDDTCCNDVGAAEIACGDDCDDTRSVAHPGAPEACDGFDNDCDGAADEGVLRAFLPDADRDGFGATAGVPVLACTPPPATAEMPGDCDDTIAAMNPGAPEVCDTLDNDCDGGTDESLLRRFRPDDDDDGFGNATVAPTLACTAPDGMIEMGGDCDDASAARNPSAVEVCDALDNDCDGVADDGLGTTFYADADGDGYGLLASATTACIRPAGHADRPGDCDDASAARSPALAEVCDGLDNDCDTVVDDGVLVTYYRDADGDGYGTAAIALPGATTAACAQPTGFAPASTDCDDARAARNPGAPEVCDGLDNDCDGLLDALGEDPDGDGRTIPACGGDDCNNARADVYPGAPELCDGLDNDCDGVLGIAEDADRDGRARVACGGDDCDDADARVFPGNAEACDGLDNDCDNLFDGPGEDVDGDRSVSIACGGRDCDDTRTSIRPGVAELCDGRDTNCDGALMAGEDDDGDGVPDLACGGTDCDDTRATVRPGADEGCDGRDTDCNGVLGPGEDADGDGVARATCGAACTGACGDCDDARPEVRPGAAELCDGRDDDCDAVLDGPGEDDDRDGHADVACGASCTATCDDCDDTRDFVHPRPPPRDCDGYDNDCDGITDEPESIFGQAYPTVGAAEMANRIAVNGSRATLVIADVSAGSRNVVLAQFSTIDGSIVTPRRFLTTGIFDEDHPRIVAAGSGYVVTWTSNASGSEQVQWARLDASGSIVSGPVPVTTGPAVPGTSTSMAVGGPAMDRTLVVYAQGGLTRRAVVDASGAVIAPGAPLGDRPLVMSDTVWDPVSLRFGVLVAEIQAYNTPLTLHRVDASGTLVGTDSVGSAYETSAVAADLAAADGRFLVHRWNGEAGPTLRYWSAASGAASDEVVIPAPLGGLGYGQVMGISPTNVWVAWNGAITVRRRSDLGPYTGAFSSSVVGYQPGSMSWAAEGLMVSSTTHNGDYAVVQMTTCR